MSDNAEMIRGAYDAFARADIESVLAALDDRVEWDVTAILPQGGSWRGKAGAAEFFQNLGGLWADLTLDVQQLISDGESVVAMGRAAGRLRGDGNAAAGYEFVHTFKVTDGKIARFREFADPDEELREHMSS